MVTINIYTSGTAQQVDGVSMSQSGGTAPSPDPNMAGQGLGTTGMGSGDDAPAPMDHMQGGSLTGSDADAPSPQLNFGSMNTDGGMVPSPSAGAGMGNTGEEAPRPTRQPEGIDGGEGDQSDMDGGQSTDAPAPDDNQEGNKSRGEEKQSRKR